jgi:hypothetical protein
MSRIVLQILQLLTLLSHSIGNQSVTLPFGLLAEKTWSQWVFSLVSDNFGFGFIPTRVFLEKVLTRKQLRELRYRLQRRLRRFEKRLLKNHQSVIDTAVDKIDQWYLPRAIERIHTQSRLRDMIIKYLTIIHYKVFVDEVSYKGQVIARRVDDDRDNYFNNSPDLDGGFMSIGKLTLCPEITPSNEILTAVAKLWQYITGNNALCMGDLWAYQKINPLVDITWKKFDYDAQFRCKPGCWCDECRSKTADCQSCLGDGCPDCEDCM